MSQPHQSCSKDSAGTRGRHRGQCMWLPQWTDCATSSTTTLFHQYRLHLRGFCPFISWDGHFQSPCLIKQLSFSLLISTICHWVSSDLECKCQGAEGRSAFSTAVSAVARLQDTTANIQLLKPVLFTCC